MSDWFIQQSGFSSDKVLGPLTSEQVVALFIRGEINKKTPLASQQHTNNEWIVFKDSVLWSKTQEVIRKQKDEKAQQAEALRQQKEEERQQLQQQHEQERIEAENQRQQQQQQQQTAEVQVEARQQEAQQQVVQVPTGQGQGQRLVTNIGGGEITAVLIAGTILEIVGGLSVAGGVVMVIIGIVTAGNLEAEAEVGAAITNAVVMAIAATLYGLLMIGLGAAMKVFGRMGQLLEQNTLTLLRILDRS
jgi:hypothetical protein